MLSEPCFVMPAGSDANFFQQNILVNSEYSAVITDFGSARIIRDVSKSVSPDTTPNPASITETPQAPLEVELDSATRELTVTGCLFTTRWAAPEILFDGKPELASDVWAFGWICWEVRDFSIFMVSPRSYMDDSCHERSLRANFLFRMRRPRPGLSFASRTR